jgi:hypothetical protein
MRRRETVMGLDLLLILILALFFFGGVGILIWKDRQSRGKKVDR